MSKSLKLNDGTKINKIETLDDLYNKLSTEINGFRDELRSEISELRTEVSELRTEVSELRTEVKENFINIHDGSTYELIAVHNISKRYPENFVKRMLFSNFHDFMIYILGHDKTDTEINNFIFKTCHTYRRNLKKFAKHISKIKGHINGKFHGVNSVGNISDNKFGLDQITSSKFKKFKVEDVMSHLNINSDPDKLSNDEKRLIYIYWGNKNMFALMHILSYSNGLMSDKLSKKQYENTIIDTIDKMVIYENKVEQIILPLYPTELEYDIAGSIERNNINGEWKYIIQFGEIKYLYGNETMEWQTKDLSDNEGHPYTTGYTNTIGYKIIRAIAQIYTRCHITSRMIQMFHKYFNMTAPIIDMTGILFIPRESTIGDMKIFNKMIEHVSKLFNEIPNLNIDIKIEEIRK